MGGSNLFDAALLKEAEIGILNINYWPFSLAIFIKQIIFK